MGANRFWIGGQTDPPFPQMWLVADNGHPYLCCKCPCVSYYAIFGFKIIQKKGVNHDDYEWCSQYSLMRPMGVDTNGIIYLDDILADQLFYLQQSETMAIDPTAGLYEECGRTEISVSMPATGTVYYEIRAYHFSGHYACYDEFRDLCFSDCTNLPCAEYDPVTQECIEHYVPDSAFVFDGTKRPYYGRISNALSQYGCLGYWQNLVNLLLIPSVSVEWCNMTLNAKILTDVMLYQIGSQTWYAADLDINGNLSYYETKWDGQGQQPTYTTAQNVSFLSSALTDIIPVISAARQTNVNTWIAGNPYNPQYQCSQWDAQSTCTCGIEDGGWRMYYKQFEWKAGKLVITRGVNTPVNSTGVKVRITNTIKSYDGTYDQQTHEYVYVETVTQEIRDVLWGTAEYLRVADNLSLNTTATACYPDLTYSQACLTPCSDLPHEMITYSLEIIEYLFPDPSSSSSSSSGAN